MRISILECLTGWCDIFFLSEINIFCIALKKVLSIAIILHWRLANICLAVNSVNFHKHAGKEREFS